MKAAVQHHPYQEDPDLARDHRGEGRCIAPCRLPRANRVHQVPETDPDTTAEEHRRLGEKED